MVETELTNIAIFTASRNAYLMDGTAMPNNGDHDSKTVEATESEEQTGKRELWERQPGETGKSYAAFQKYLNLAERRTLAKVAEMSGCSAQNIERWSRRWCWVARVQAWDGIEEQKFREQLSRDRVTMRRRQIQLGIACQNVAAFGIRELQAKIAAGTPLDLAPQEIKDLLAVGSALEGKGMGEEKSSKFTRIQVVMGHHRYPNEACGCKCAACASCHGEGPVVENEMVEVRGSTILRSTDPN